MRGGAFSAARSASDGEVSVDARGVHRGAFSAARSASDGEAGVDARGMRGGAFSAARFASDGEVSVDARGMVHAFKWLLPTRAAGACRPLHTSARLRPRPHVGLNFLKWFTRHTHTRSSLLKLPSLTAAVLIPPLPAATSRRTLSAPAASTSWRRAASKVGELPVPEVVFAQVVSWGAWYRPRSIQRLKEFVTIAGLRAR